MLDGRVDAWIFPVSGTKRWDTCAGEALLRAHGGWLVVRPAHLHTPRAAPFPYIHTRSQTLHRNS